MNTVPIPTTSPRRSRFWGTLAVVVLLMFALAVLALVSSMNPIDHAPIQVPINGQPWVGGLDLASLPPPHKVLVACLIAVAVLAALVIVPLALLVAVLVVVLVLVAAIGLPLLALVLLTALALSPLLLLGWLLWRAVRPASPTMPT